MTTGGGTLTPISSPSTITARTLADMTLRVAKRVCSMGYGKATSGTALSLTDTDNLQETTGSYDNGTLWLLEGAYASAVRKITTQVTTTLNWIYGLAAALCTQQVETATAVGSVTGDGNAAVVVTAAGMSNTPKTVTVAVLNGDSASDVGGKIRTALGLDADVIAFFTVGGSGANAVLTARRARSNDTTMNISIDNDTCTGLTAAPTSANTTAGVDGPTYAIAEPAIPYEQIVAAINSALRETTVLTEDASLTGDDTTLLFALPSGLADIDKVEIERSDDADSRYLKTHWYEEPGYLRFDRYFAPRDEEILHIWYARPHDQLIDPTDAIDANVRLKWLEAKATFNVLMWARGIYQGDPDYDIDTRIQVVNDELQGMAKAVTPRLRWQSAGSGPETYDS